MMCGEKGRAGAGGEGIEAGEQNKTVKMSYAPGSTSGWYGVVVHCRLRIIAGIDSRFSNK